MKKLVDFLQKLHNENGDELPVKTTWYKSTKLPRESYTSLREVSSWFGQSFPRSAPLSIARSQYAKKFPSQVIYLVCSSSATLCHHSSRITFGENLGFSTFWRRRIERCVCSWEAALTKRTGGSSSLHKSTKLCENLPQSSPELLDGLKTQFFFFCWCPSFSTRHSGQLERHDSVSPSSLWLCVVSLLLLLIVEVVKVG